MTLTAEQLETVQRYVALRMSVNDDAGLSWAEWAHRIQKRVKNIEAYTAFGERPSFYSALYLTADAMSLLCLLDQALLADPMSGEEAA